MMTRDHSDPRRPISPLASELAILMRVASIAFFLITVGLVLPEALLRAGGDAVLAALVLLPASIFLMASAWIARA